MFLGELRQEVGTVRGIGPATARRLEKLGIRAVKDLLLHVPRSYEDRTEITPLSRAHERPKACVVATVVSQSEFVSREFGAGRGRTLKVLVSDETACASLVCFGRPFLRSVMKPGRKFFIWGSFSVRFGELQSTDFELEPWTENPSGFGKILPLYPLTEGLTQGALRRAVWSVLQSLGGKLEDELPADVRQRRALCSKAAAIRGMHFPDALPRRKKA